MCTLSTLVALCLTATAGKALEAELNAVGPGEALFVYCDVTSEEDIKVSFYGKTKS